MASRKDSHDKLDELNELLTQMQMLQMAQQDETLRLRRRLEWLEQRRREFFDLISSHGADSTSKRKLEETERQHDEIQALLLKSEADLKRMMREIRERVLDMRNEELTRLEDEIKILREQREVIRTTLVPEAQARVDALREQDARIGQQCDALTRRIRDLNEIDFPVPNQSQVA